MRRLRPVSAAPCIALLVVSACARERDAAPEDLDGLSSYVFQHWENAENLQEGMGNLALWLDGEGRSEASAEGYVLSDLTEEEVADVDHPGRDLALLVGVALPWVSPHDILAHAELVVREDQIWNDTSSYDLYTREIVEGDVESFAAGSGIVRTRSDVDKKGAFGVHIPYELWKDYAWVDLGEQGRAVVGRSWTAEVACAEGGSNCLNQSFSIDLFYAPEAGETIRLTATWNELVTDADGLLTDDARIGLMVNGLTDIFENTDDLLASEQ